MNAAAQKRAAAGSSWPGSRYLLPAGAAVAAVGLQLGGDRAQGWSRYDAAGIQAGELWRLVTGHLVHLSWEHLIMNLAGLGVLYVLFGTQLRLPTTAGVGLASMLAIDAGLYFGSTELVWYVGLSGVLHGIWAAGGLLLLTEERVRGAALVGLLVAKLAWEQLLGPLPMSESTAGGPVVTIAHLYGAAGGSGWVALVWAATRLRSRRL